MVILMSLLYGHTYYGDIMSLLYGHTYYGDIDVSAVWTHILW